MSDKPTIAAASLAAQHGVPQQTIRRALTHYGNDGILLDLLTSEQES